MDFDAQFHTEKVIEWIKNWFDNYSGGAKGIILGISGGKDSTIAAALCAKAIGKDRVIGILMPNGDQKDIDDSCEVCDILGIQYRVVDISKIYNSFNESIRYSKNYKDNDYVDNFFALSPHTCTNISPRIRMSILYAIGQELGYRVCGTVNASEAYIGYCTKWGDMACDFNPLGNFTMDEVVAIGDVLDLPEHLIHKTPSDGLCGKTDEDNFGFSYEVLNDYIHGFDCKDKETQKKIEKMHEYNKHKLNPIPKY